MDFDDTPAEAAFRAEARAFLEAHAPKVGSDGDFATAYLEGTLTEEEHLRRAKAWQAFLYDQGWAGITWPKEHGGRGGTAMESIIWNQEQAGYGVNMGPFVISVGMAGPTIIKHGTEAQRDRYLAPMLRGDEIWCQLFSEPGAGSDLANISTRAVADGDDWVVTGQKVWTSSAQRAQFGMLLARSDPDATKHKGITYFLLDMSTPGIDIRPLKQMNGQSHFSEVFLDEVRVPASAVLGEVHGGWGPTLTTLANERGQIAGGSKGADARSLIALAKRRGATGDPLVRQELTDLWILDEVRRYITLRMQTAISQGRPPGPETSTLKLLYAEYLRRMGNVALQVLGPEGMLAGDGPDGGWVPRFLHAPAIRIAGGSNEIQRNVIGERVLGLPGDLRVDRDVPFRELAQAGR